MKTPVAKERKQQIKGTSFFLSLKQKYEPADKNNKVTKNTRHFNFLSTNDKKKFNPIKTNATEHPKNHI